jgi:hypothetical protein
MAKRSNKTARSARVRSSKVTPTGHTLRPTETIDDFIGLLAGKTKKVATIEEINQATRDGWAGKVKI